MPRTKDASRALEPDSRVTARLITTIKELISSGTIPPGGKFPPERELAKELKVNRASLRQVMNVLEIMGVLTQRVGDGTYLSASSELILKEPLEFMVLIDDISPGELFETRSIVEPELAARAARIPCTGERRRASARLAVGNPSSRPRLSPWATTPRT